MIAVISEYIRNLAIFLLFMSFVGIVAPDGKLKKYLNLVTGFVLLFLMISPIANLTNNLDDIFSFMDSSVQVDNFGSESHMRLQRDLIANTASDNLSEQLEIYLNSMGVYTKDINVQLSIEEENFLDILGIYIILQEENQRGLIQIDRIRPFEITEEDPRIIEIRDMISSFYNVSKGDIHIVKDG